MQLDLEVVKQNVEIALKEDLGGGDVTSRLLPLNLTVNAVIESRESLVLCGKPWVEMVFALVDENIKLEWLADEGSWVDGPQALCKLSGPARSILTAERCALNFLQTLSATATQVYQYVCALEGSNTRLLDTRKTIPGLRHAQKYAVFCAGGMNHRQGLYDAFLIKENHIKACGSIKAAVQLAQNSGLNLLVEVEVETLDEFKEALEAQPDRIMLDNFSIKAIEEAVAIRKGHTCELEVSGGVDLSTLKAIAATGVDFVSVGAVTKSIRAIDLSLLVK